MFLIDCLQKIASVDKYFLRLIFAKNYGNDNKINDNKINDNKINDTRTDTLTYAQWDQMVNQKVAQLFPKVATSVFILKESRVYQNIMQKAA